MATLKARNENGGTPKHDYWGIDSEYGVLSDVLIGPIDHYHWLETSALSKRNIRLGYTFDHIVAKSQWTEMVNTFQDVGVKTHFLSPDESLPYQVYARDSSVMTPWGAIITQMSQPWRRGESAPCIRFYTENDIPIYEIITGGSFEGGDFMVLEPGLVLCGYTGERTDENAFNQMRSWFEAEGWEVKGYNFDPFFVHMDCQFAVLSDKLAVACLDVLESDFIDWLKAKNYELIEISFKDMLDLGTNVVSLGNDRVMVPKSSAHLIGKCKALGLQVYDPDLSMISKGGGAVHCMTQALRRNPVQ